MKMTFLKKLIVFFVFFSVSIQPFIGITSSKAIEKEIPITIEFDERLELLGVIRILNSLSNYYACEFMNTVFKRDAVSWFKPYKNHPAVQSYKNFIDNKNFSDDQCREFILSLGAFPDLKIPENQLEAYQNESWLIWRRELLDFCDDANFRSFLIKENDLYQLILDQYKLPSSQEQDLEKIFKVFNERHWSIRFILSPLLFQENQFIVLRPENEIQFTCIFGLSGIDNGRLLFASNETYAYYFRELLIAHMTKIIIERFPEEIIKLKALFDPIKEKMNSLGIVTWEDCLLLHISLSIKTYLFTDNSDDEIKMWQKKGFLYFPETFELIQQYEKYRSYFPTLYSFMPRIFTQYERILRSKP